MVYAVTALSILASQPFNVGFAASFLGYSAGVTNNAPSYTPGTTG